MRTRSLSLALVSALLDTALEAQSVVLPAAATNWQGPYGEVSVFFHNALSPGFANEARTQLVYDLAEIPDDVRTVRALAFRKWSKAGLSFQGGGTIQLDVRMSTSSQDPNFASAVFAENEGPAPTSVFSGTAQLPATTAGPWPRPWSVVLPLRNPFTIERAPGDRALVVDVRCWDSTVGMPWLTEVYDTDVGLLDLELVQGDCLDANGSPQLSASVSEGLLVRGGFVGLLFYNYPNQPILQNNALAIGLHGVGGSFLGQTLPFPLASAGLPSPPNCRWSVEPLAWVPMQFSSVGGAGSLDTGSSLPIPDDPRVVGLRLVVQNVALMQFTSGVRLFPSMTLGLTIRSGEDPAGTTVSSAGDRNATSGFPRHRRPVAVELRG